MPGRNLTENISRNYLNSIRTEVLLSFVEDFAFTRNSGIRILDVGCNDCEFLFRVHKKLGAGFDLYLEGLDIVGGLIGQAEEKNISLGKPVSKLWIMDVEKETPDRQYDILIFQEIIEHLEQPEECLRRFAEILKPGSILIMSSLNLDSKIRLLGKTITKVFGGWFRNLYWSGSVHKKPEPISSSEAWASNLVHGHVSSKSAKHWIRVMESEGCLLRDWAVTSFLPSPVIFRRSPLFSGLFRTMEGIARRASWAREWGIGFAMVFQKTGR